MLWIKRCIKYYRKCYCHAILNFYVRFRMLGIFPWEITNERSFHFCVTLLAKTIKMKAPPSYFKWSNSVSFDTNILHDLLLLKKCSKTIISLHPCIFNDYKNEQKGEYMLQDEVHMTPEFDASSKKKDSLFHACSDALYPHGISISVETVEYPWLSLCIGFTLHTSRTPWIVCLCARARPPLYWTH